MKKYIFFFFVLLILGVHAPIFAGIKVSRISGANLYWRLCTDRVIVNSRTNPYKAQFEITLYYTNNRGFANLLVAQNENSNYYIPVDLYYNSRIKLNTYYRFSLRVSSDGTKIDNIDAWEIACPSGVRIRKIEVPLVNCAPNCLAIYSGVRSTHMKTFYTDRPIAMLNPGEQEVKMVSDFKKPTYVIPAKLISPYIDQKNWQGGLDVLKNYHQELINKKQITPNMPEMDFKNFLKSNQQYLEKELNTGMLFSEPEIKKKFPDIYKK